MLLGEASSALAQNSKLRGQQMQREQPVFVSGGGFIEPEEEEADNDEIVGMNGYRANIAGESPPEDVGGDLESEKRG